MSLTHYEGQKIVECMGCEKTVRLKPVRVWTEDPRTVYCNQCGSRFDVALEDVLNG